MKWKLIVSHACLLFLAGVVVGILEIRPDPLEIRGLLVSYLLNAAALFLVEAGIYVNLAYRASSRPWLHAGAAALLNELAAGGLFLIFFVDSFGAAWSLAVFDHVISLAALLLGTFTGSRLRRMPRVSM